MTRTTRSFPTPNHLWSTVEAWASEKGYWSRESTGSARTYQKGTGFLVAPMMLTLSEENGTVSMEAWVRAGTFVRLFALFLIPSEMPVESGGFKMSLPRKIARNTVNDLLSRLGQPPIP